MTQPIQFTSTCSNIEPVSFETAVLQGFAPDGGLFVPDRLPQFSRDDLVEMASLKYTDVCSRILSRFIDPQIIPQNDLDRIIESSFSGFEHPDVVPLVPAALEKNVYIMELFHGPTQSFKDIAMGFLVRTMDYLLARKNQKLNIILATTGDTGPAAAYAAAGLSTINCWPLFPKGMISLEQEGQMTGITAPNIHPVGVTHCSDGGDDLDRVILHLFSDSKRKERLQLSSVNSINWCRVMVQSVHYFYAYCQACLKSNRKIGSEVAFSVPSGAFGNLFAGYLAREMGLPIQTFICAVNANQTLYRAFTDGIFAPSSVISTVSSAIDIALPYNFWRFLYFSSGRNITKIKQWMHTLNSDGKVQLDRATRDYIDHGFTTVSVTDNETLKTMREYFEYGSPYLIDPHGAVALSGALRVRSDDDTPMVSLATAHPAKFPDVVTEALGLSSNSSLPPAALHPNLRKIPEDTANLSTCSLGNLEDFLIHSIENV